MSTIVKSATTDDILTRIIPIPQPGQVALSVQAVSAIYLPTIQQMAEALATAQAHMTALTQACGQMNEQIAALKAEVARLTVPPDAVSP